MTNLNLTTPGIYVSPSPGYKALFLEIEGIGVYVPLEQKPHLLSNGIVSVNVPYDSGILPSITIPAGAGGEGPNKAFESGPDNVSDDPRLVEAVKTMIEAAEAGTWEAGTVLQWQ